MPNSTNCVAGMYTHTHAQQGLNRADWVTHTPTHPHTHTHSTHTHPHTQHTPTHTHTHTHTHTRTQHTHTHSTASTARIGLPSCTRKGTARMNERSGAAAHEMRCADDVGACLFSLICDQVERRRGSSAHTNGGETGGPARMTRQPQRRGDRQGASSARKRVSTTPVGKQSLHLRSTTCFRAAGAAGAALPPVEHFLERGEGIS